MKERFNKQFVDEDTGLLNIGKYDYDRVMEFIEKELEEKEKTIKTMQNIINTILKSINKYYDNPS